MNSPFPILSSQLRVPCLIFKSDYQLCQIWIPNWRKQICHTVLHGKKLCKKMWEENGNQKKQLKCKKMSFQSVVLKAELRVLLQIEKLVTIGFRLAADQQAGPDIVIVHIHTVFWYLPYILLILIALITHTQQKKSCGLLFGCHDTRLNRVFQFNQFKRYPCVEAQDNLAKHPIDYKCVCVSGVVWLCMFVWEEDRERKRETVCDKCERKRESDTI